MKDTEWSPYKGKKAVVYGLEWDIDFKDYPDMFGAFVKEKSKAERFFEEGRNDEELLISRLLENGEIQSEEDFDRDYTTFEEYFNEKEVKAEFIERYLGLPKSCVVATKEADTYVKNLMNDFDRDEVIEALHHRYGDYRIKNEDTFEFTGIKGHGMEVSRQNIKDAVENIIDRADFKAYLDLYRNFENYSVNNKILIYSQKPTATLVKGGNAWRELGRHTKTMAKSLFIYAPNIKSFPPSTTPKELKEYVKSHNSYATKMMGGHYLITQEDLDKALEKLSKGMKVSLLIGTSLVLVYDVSDTYGKELPKIEEKVCDEKKGAYLLAEFCKDIGASNCIDAGVAETASNLADYLLHGDGLKVPLISHESDLSDSKKKLERDAIAFLIADYFGVDASGRLEGMGRAFDKDPVGLRTSLFTEVMERVDKTVRYITRECERIEKTMQNEIEEEEEIER